MASVIERRDGRFEIRESVAGPKGPRSRTLAVFSKLSADLLERADQRATRPFDRTQVLRRAMELEVPWVGPSGLSEARSVLARLADGELPPTFVAALRESTASSRVELPDSIPPMLDWVGADDTKRGRALRDLVQLGDVIVRSIKANPKRLAYPPIRGT
ncbi:MAG: hypothetical protein WD646_13960 [Actinomycetota bacterium]